MRYVLGLDGGGTKTECVVARDDGAIVGHARGGGVNRNFINAEGFERSVHDAVQGALDSAPEVHELAWVVGSMSCDGVTMRAIAQAYHLEASHMQWVGESLPARSASEVAHQRIPDLVVVSGTGSLVSGWGVDGRQRVVGGAGSIVGDEGSAYWVGVRALTRLVECFDGRRPFERFARELTDAIGIHEHRKLIDYVYGHGVKPITRDEMAAVAPHVSVIANNGEPFAIDLFRRAGEELAFQANAVIRMLGLQNEPVQVQLYGGCFRAGRVIIEPLQQAVCAYNARAQMLPPLKGTAIGAAAMALRAIGIDVSDAQVRQHLLDGGRQYDLL
jgi:N-acetylglucosamine kinase-like BadF-type ATPase